MSQLCLRRLFVSLLLSGALAAPVSAAPGIDLQDLALPSDLKDIAKSPGAVFYSSPNKNKTLMPVHFWGEVGRPGLHFIPIDSELVKGLSFAGGGNSGAKLDEVRVSRVESGKLERLSFNLDEGGDDQAYRFVLRPGDTVFVQKDRFHDNRAYYTSLVGVVATIISAVFIFKRIDDQ
jgi:hypothetical protein